MRRLACAALVAALVSASPAAASLAAASSGAAFPGAGAETVGGPQLASRGIVAPSTGPATGPGTAGARSALSAEGAPASGALPAVPDVAAASYVLADVDSGEVLAAKDPHGRYLPASTLKILTALVLIPRLDSRRVVTATVADTTVVGSKVGIVPSGRYAVGDLLRALLVVSGNDAASALAAAAGGPARTVELMNAEAQRLNALDTLARTPSGLDAPGQTSSAYDLALVTRAALALPAFRSYVATRRTTFPGTRGSRFEIYNHNRLLERYPGAIGVKNGFTSAARATFVGAATRDGRTLVVTLMRSQPRVWDEAAKLLDWGFATAGRAPAVGALVAPVPPVPAAPPAAAPAGAPVAAAPPEPPVKGDVPLPLALATGLGTAIVGLRLRARRRLARRRPALPPL